VIDSESSAETARLMDQDILLTQQLGGLFPLAVDSSDISDILDIACGPGGWALNVAHAYPHARVTGVDISQTLIRYAKAQAQVQGLHNAHFKVMDVLKPLDFEDHSFDLVNARLLYGFMPTRAWPGLLLECMRILTPGGLICLTECETGITNGPISERLNALFLQAMQRAGMLFSPDARHVGITPMLAGLLRDAGFKAIHQRAEVLDYSAGTPIHEAFCQTIMIGSKLIQPFVVKMGVTTQQEVEQLYQQCLQEVYADEFRGIWYYLRVWGRKA
jgi:ubiquinone/menaquinone biosynthesis C-methylase UbiE